MKNNIFNLALLLFCFTSLLLAQSCNKRPINNVPDFAKIDSEYLVRNWQLSNPVSIDASDSLVSNNFITSEPDQGDKMKKFKDFESVFTELRDNPDSLIYNPFSRTNYTVIRNYVAVDTLFNNYKPGICYAGTIIRSPNSQDIALIAGATSGMKVWLNGNLMIKGNDKNFRGYQYVIPAHLNAGDNFILEKVQNPMSTWQFFLKISSQTYVRKYSLIKDYSSFCKHYLLNNNDSLQIGPLNPFLSKNTSYHVIIKNIADKICFDKWVNLRNPYKLSLAKFDRAPYSIQLESSQETFKQNFFYGSDSLFLKVVETKIFSYPLANLKYYKSNIKMLINRYHYLDSVKVVHDNAYERKVAMNLFQIDQILQSISAHNDPFKNVNGLELRNQFSDYYSDESYMIYVPQNYTSKSKIPLLVMMPYFTALRPFYYSIYVSRMDEVEYMSKLADKYNCAIVWTNGRCYDRSGEITMVPQALFTTVKDIEQNYNIDTTKIYAYGSCGGGGLALFIANRFPSYFAAVGVEGPAIQNKEAYFPTAKNYYNTPIKFIHSKWNEKIPYKLSKELSDSINASGGHALLEDLYVKETPILTPNFMPDNKIFDDFFSFFKNKTLHIPDTIYFSTNYLKYNHSYWMTIDDIEDNKQASFLATFNSNVIKATVRNVRSFTLQLSQIPNIRLDKPLKIIVNNKITYNGKVTKNYHLVLSKNKDNSLRKTSLTEGPINDFFTNPFIVVRGYQNNDNEKAVIDTFVNDWAAHYFSNCIVKDDKDLTANDIANYNLVLIGKPSSNMIMNSIYKNLPFKISNKDINVGKHHLSGNELSFQLIYPNPGNRNKYILYISSNCSKICPQMIHDLAFRAWTDFEVWDNSTQGQVIGADFNNNWQ